jgi:hypothetical protein
MSTTLSTDDGVHPFPRLSSSGSSLSLNDLWHDNAVPDAVDVDSLSNSNTRTDYPDDFSVVKILPLLDATPESYHTSQSRSMSLSSLDDGAESDQFMSMPGTPTADGDATFRRGKSGHGCLIFCGLSQLIRSRNFVLSTARFRIKPHHTPPHPRSSEWFGFT